MTKRNILRDNELFIIDLDGVVYEGGIPIVNAVESVCRLHSIGKKIAFFTNNSTLTPESYKTKLSRMGIVSEASQVYTSATISARSLKNIHGEGRTVFVVGEDGLLNALANVGFSILNYRHKCDDVIRNKAIKADMVIAGLDRTITYKKLAAASLLILRGSKFYASNMDATLPDPSGLLPGAGAIVTFLSTTSGIKLEKVFGKPHPDGILQILKDFSCPSSKTVMIGDRLDTDILCGKNAKINTAVVLTGITQKSDMDKVCKIDLPDYILGDLSEIFK